MAQVSVQQVITIHAPVAAIYHAIVDYAHYPKFMMGIKKTKVQKKIDENTAVVRYEVSLLGRQLSYDLNMISIPGKALTWTLNKSKYLESNHGGWHLSPQGKDKCKVKYSLDFELDIPAPGFIIRQGAKTYVNQMLTQFKAYCEDQLS